MANARERGVLVRLAKGDPEAVGMDGRLRGGKTKTKKLTVEVQKPKKKVKKTKSIEIDASPARPWIEYLSKVFLKKF